MTLKLAKTVGGQHGTPANCKCGSRHFLKSGFGWSCGECGSYLPPDFKSVSPFEDMRTALAKLQGLNDRLIKQMKETQELLSKR